MFIIFFLIFRIVCIVRGKLQIEFLCANRAQAMDELGLAETNFAFMVGLLLAGVEVSSAFLFFLDVILASGINKRFIALFLYSGNSVLQLTTLVIH